MASFYIVKVCNGDYIKYKKPAKYIESIKVMIGKYKVKTPEIAKRS